MAIIGASVWTVWSRITPPPTLGPLCPACLTPGAVLLLQSSLIQVYYVIYVVVVVVVVVVVIVVVVVVCILHLQSSLIQVC